MLDSYRMWLGLVGETGGRTQTRPAIFGPNIGDCGTLLLSFGDFFPIRNEDATLRNKPPPPAPPPKPPPAPKPPPKPPRISSASGASPVSAIAILSADKAWTKRTHDNKKKPNKCSNYETNWIKRNFSETQQKNNRKLCKKYTCLHTRDVLYIDLWFDS